MNNPILYIIAGCNGAGKTTAAFALLPNELNCTEFVNADEIAKGLSPFNPEEVAIQAGRLMLDRIYELLNQKKTFAIETTLATKSYSKLIETAHSNGYEVSLLFFWLPTVAQAKQRVAQRVANGGHNIHENVIERRYLAGINNLFKIFIPIVDSWYVFNNERMPFAIANNMKIIDVKQYKKLQSYVR